MKKMNVLAVTAASMVIAGGVNSAEGAPTQPGWNQISGSAADMSKIALAQYRKDQETDAPNIQTKMTKLGKNVRKLSVLIDAKNQEGQYHLTATMKRKNGKLQPSTTTRFSISTYTNSGRQVGKDDKGYTFAFSSAQTQVDFTGDAGLEDIWHSTAAYSTKDAAEVRCDPSTEVVGCRALPLYPVSSGEGFFDRKTYSAITEDARAQVAAAVAGESVSAFHEAPAGLPLYACTFVPLAPIK